MFIDSHAHLEMPQFEEDLSEVIQRASHHGVEHIISIGTSLEFSKRAVQIAQTYPQVFAAVGIHPHDSRQCSPEAMDQLRLLAGGPKVVAIGETGLDFYRNLSSPEQQIHAFRMQISLARQLGKPIIVHDRNAHNLLIRILEEESAHEVGGVIHCFSGDLSKAKQCLDMSFFISIPGSITFKNAARLRHVVLNLPLESILLETDSPFLAPIPYRGKRNEPAYIRYTAERVAKIRKMSVEDLANAACQNTRRLFRLPMNS